MSRTLFACCILGTVLCLLSSCAKSKGVQKVGEHNVVIIETHLLHGGTSHTTIQGAEGGRQVLTYEGRNLIVRLEDEVLTVNGRKYLIPRKDDAITIRNHRVEINGQPAKPEDE